MNHMEVMKLIAKDSKLSRIEIRVLLAILSFSRKQKKQIKRSYLSDLLDIHSQNISRTTKNLERKGYLSRDYSDGVCSYEIVMEMIRSQNHHSDGNETSQNHHFDGNDTSRHYIKDITVLDIDIQKGGSGGETDPIPYAEIIRDLNEVSQKNFMSSGKKNREVIKARWNEGFRLKDFFHVNKVKTEEWLNDPKMDQHLNPETLYSNKFHKYVNQKLKAEIEKSANEEKRNAPETQDAIVNLNLLQRGLNKQLN